MIFVSRNMKMQGMWTCLMIIDLLYLFSFYVARKEVAYRGLGE